MIDLNKIYTFEECGDLCGKSYYYFKGKADNKEVIAMATDPTRPYLKAIYGRHLVRFLQKYKFGLQLLKKWNQPTLDDDYFINDDIEQLEEELKHWIQVKEERLEALHKTLTRIDKVKAKIETLRSKQNN